MSSCALNLVICCLWGPMTTESSSRIDVFQFEQDLSRTTINVPEVQALGKLFVDDEDIEVSGIYEKWPYLSLAGSIGVSGSITGIYEEAKEGLQRLNTEGWTATEPHWYKPSPRYYLSLYTRSDDPLAQRWIITGTRSRWSSRENAPVYQIGAILYDSGNQQSPRGPFPRVFRYAVQPPETMKIRGQRMHEIVDGIGVKQQIGRFEIEMEQKKARQQELLRLSEEQIRIIGERWKQQSEQTESKRYGQDILQRRLLDMIEDWETYVRDDVTSTEKDNRLSLSRAMNAEGHKTAVVNALLRQQMDEMKSMKDNQESLQRRLDDIKQEKDDNWKLLLGSSDLRDVVEATEEKDRNVLHWAMNAEQNEIFLDDFLKEHSNQIESMKDNQDYLRQRLINAERGRNQEKQEHLQDSEIQIRSVVELTEEKDRSDLDKTMLTERMRVSNVVPQELPPADHEVDEMVVSLDDVHQLMSV